MVDSKQICVVDNDYYSCESKIINQLSIGNIKDLYTIIVFPVEMTRDFGPVNTSDDIEAIIKYVNIYSIKLCKNIGIPYAAINLKDRQMYNLRFNVLVDSCGSGNDSRYGLAFQVESSDKSTMLILCDNKLMLQARVKTTGIKTITEYYNCDKKVDSITRIDNRVEVYSKYQNGKEILQQCYNYENDGTQCSAVATRFNTDYKSPILNEELLFYHNNVSNDLNYLKYLTKKTLDDLLIPDLLDIILSFITY